MSGRDVPTQEKALSVAFSVIMVLSMVAVGMAGFAGSAGATQQPDNGGAVFAATPADSDAQDSAHVYTVGVGSTLSGDSISNDGGSTIDIDYSDSNIDVTDISEGDISQVTVEHVATDGSVTDLLTEENEGNLDVSHDSQNNLQITIDPTGTDGSTAVTLSEGDSIRIVLGTSGTDGVDQSSASDSSTVDITTGGTDFSSNTFSADVELGSNAPIQVSDTSGGEFHYSLQQALADANQDATVDVTGDVDEFISQPNSVTSGGLSAISPTATGITVQGTSDATQNVTIVNDGGTATTIDIDQDGTAVQDLNFNSSNVLGQQSTSAITATGGASSIDISDNSFNATTISGTVVDLTGQTVSGDIDANSFEDISQGSDYTGINTDDTNGALNITNNNLANVSGGTGILVGGMSGHTLTVESNTMDVDGGTGISVDANDADAQATIEANDIEGNDNTDTGIVVDETGGNDAPTIDIIGGSVNNTAIGIDATGDVGDFLNITDVELTNVTSVGIDTGTNNFDGTGSEILNIDGATITGDASVVAIDIDDTNADVDIQNTDITDVNDGVDITGAADYNLTSVTVETVDAGNAINLDDGANDPSTLESITIDNASGATGIRVNGGVDLDVVDSSVNDTNLGIDVAAAGSFFNVSNTDITNSNTQGINLQADNSEVSIDGETSIDQATTGIAADLNGGTKRVVSIDSVTVNGTTTAGIDVSNAGNSDDDLSVQSSTISQNAIGVNFAANADNADARYDVNFNTFEQNDVGLEVADLQTGGVIINATFNNFVDSDTAGLNIPTAQNNNDVVNANYSWWDNRDSSRIVGPYTPQNAGSQLPIPRRVYSYTRLHTGGQP